MNDASTCAITGGAFYNPQVPQFPSNFIGNYFFADFCGGWIRKLDLRMAMRLRILRPAFHFRWI
jgi:hypothetical protein